MRTAISFLRCGKRVDLIPSHPTQTVLDYLRLDEKSKGTKEGCNEGDCGACTIAVGRVEHGRLVYRPVNACILFVGQLQGCDLVTVDDLMQNDILHPVQEALVRHHASQCGFCTPGFVMSLFTLYHQRIAPSRQDIVDHLAGNLCRCTGYRPIIDAAQEVCTGHPLDDWMQREQQTRAALVSLKTDEDVFIQTGNGFLAIPQTATALATVVYNHPDATIVSGATDVGLWVNKQLRVLPKVVHTFDVTELHAIRNEPGELQIGAAATYGEAIGALSAVHADVGEIMRRIGSMQVRASGTIGGNIANGSPIGDMAPLLIALGANLVLRHGENERWLKLEDFFIAYGKQDRKPGELVWRIDVPKLGPNERFTALKISKRFDQDISAVMFALKLRCEGHRVTAARLAMGGMAATPKRALRSEAALSQIDLRHEATWPPALEAIALDYQPISDMRASADYRIETAKSLLHKALLEIAGEADTRILMSRNSAA